MWFVLHPVMLVRMVTLSFPKVNHVSYHSVHRVGHEQLDFLLRLAVDVRKAFYYAKSRKESKGENNPDPDHSALK